MRLDEAKFKTGTGTFKTPQLLELSGLPLSSHRLHRRSLILN
jgi:hypothetical protein